MGSAKLWRGENFQISTRRNFQGLFIIAGIALVIVGLNNSYPIIIAGGAMIALGLLDRFLGGASQ